MKKLILILLTALLLSSCAYADDTYVDLGVCSIWVMDGFSDVTKLVEAEPGQTVYYNKSNGDMVIFQIYSEEMKNNTTLQLSVNMEKIRKGFDVDGAEISFSSAGFKHMMMHFLIKDKSFSFIFLPDCVVLQTAVSSDLYRLRIYQTAASNIM